MYALGFILLVTLTVCSRHFSDRGGLYFMVALTIAGIAYLLSIRELFRSSRFPRSVLALGLVFAALWHVEFLRLAPGPDDDIHRYVWDGRLQRLGYNPYIVIPSDPAVKGLHTSETRTLNNPDLPSPYPAGAQLFFRIVTAIHESTFALKMAFVICEWAIAFVLLDLLRRAEQGTHLVLAFIWNPLLAVEVAGSGHIDIVGALLLVLSLAALGRRWRALAAVSLGLAVAVKFLPIVLLPLYWKRVRVRDAVLATAVVALLYVPFLQHGRVPIGSLGAYVQTFRFNGPVFAVLHHLAPPQALIALAVVVGLATASWLRRTQREWSPEVFAWPMAASLFSAPAVFPWYLLWLVPFLTSPSTILIAVWTVSIIPTYIMWHLRSVTGVWGSLPVWVMLVEYGCVAAIGAILALRRLICRTIIQRQLAKEARHLP
jgi:Glycosyltransferase family 87